MALYLKRYYRRQSEISGWLSGYLFQMLQAVVKLRSAGAEDRALSRWADSYADWLAIDLKTRRISGRFAAITGLYSAFGLIGLYAISQIYSGNGISAGAFIAFLAAFAGFQSAFQGLSATIVEWLSLTPDWERAKPLLGEEREDQGGAGDPGELSGAIEIVGVTFSYDDGPPILNHLSLNVEPGEHVALVGPSGSGKSTIVRLLLALETPTTGSHRLRQSGLARP